MLLGFWALTLGGCCWRLWPAQPPPTALEVVGHYRGNRDGLAETLEIKADGTFHQQVRVRGRVYEASGRWWIDGRLVWFDEMLDTGFGGSPPYPMGNVGGLWVVDRHFAMLVFDEDSGYGGVKRQEAP